LNRAKKFKENL